MKQILKRVLGSLLVLLLVSLVGGTAWIYWRVRASLPQLDGEVAAAGLSGRVEVLRDAHGVPHLRAQSLEDLAFAQGYVTAQDRLWQMDLSRRLAAGELSEIFGERTLRFDIENRTLGFRQACERAVKILDPESRKLLGLYAQGVNTFIATHAHRLPIEFLLLGYDPRPWRAEDSFGIALNMAKGLNWMWPDELMREHIRAKVGNELYADLFPDHSPLDHPVADVSGLGARGSGLGIRDTRVANPQPPTPNPDSVDPVLAARIPLNATAIPQSRDRRYSADAGVGSNNWVLSGSHTQSGKPLLANDPHLGHSIPSVWYMIHLKAPGLNVSGVSLPGVPLVIIGHNERIAWGMTNVNPDVQDLYVESFNFHDPHKYLHNGEWVEAEFRDEVIKVRHQSDYRLTVKVTRHGPVISHDGERDLALRWTAIEPQALRFPFLRIDRAGNWQEFQTALRDFAGPMQNFVYADVDGNIGYYAAGWVPIRKQGDGTLPSPGSTDDYDWRGYIPFEELPHAYNPPGGMLATANGRIVPDGYPYLISKKWEAPFRTARIYQLLEAGAGTVAPAVGEASGLPRERGALPYQRHAGLPISSGQVPPGATEAGSHFTVADMLRIQTDIHTLEDEWLSKQLVAASLHHPAATPDAQYALSLLPNWDAEAKADSAATLVCEVTRRALLERILKPKLGDNVSGYRWAMSTVFLQNVLENRWQRWLPPGDASFDDTLVKSLEEGVRRIPELVHTQSHAAWKWGETIPLTFRHPLSGGQPLLGRWLDVGPLPQAGTGTTVKQTTPAVGPSMRMVVDFSDLDQSVQNLTLGESGQVLSPYYRDQLDAWYNGRSFPMLFSDAAVDKVAVHKLVLKPGAVTNP
jgi:penicillin amidase